MSLDMLIRNANIWDGSGAPAYRGHVGVRDGKIEFAGANFPDARAQVTIEGAGLHLAPGFIDVHAHYDIPVMEGDRVNFWKLSQGITAEVSGNCGISLAPVSARHLGLWRDFLKNSSLYPLPAELSEFTSYAAYFGKLERIKIPIRMAYLIGHSAVRAAVMGFENRNASAGELNAMKDLVREGMEAGAFGLSSGLFCAPGIFAPTDELVELCKIVQEYGGVYATHTRSSGAVESNGEAIEIGKQTGVSVQISHLKVSKSSREGLAYEILRMIGEANNEGIDVTADIYPYTSGCSALNFIIPPYYMQEGVAKMVEYLQNKEMRAKIALEIQDPENHNCGYDETLIVAAPKTPQAVGKTVEEYAKIEGVEPSDALFDILVENGGEGLAAWLTMREEDVEIFLRSPYVMFGTDGEAVPDGYGTHPRTLGAFPKILGRYVREKGVISCSEAIRKMTSLPAQKFGLKNKGLIRAGYDADLVLFDAESIADHADFQNCRAHNEGIEAVVVGGRIVVSDNQYSGCTPGGLLRSGKRG
ncbi:MAG: D-aminoacylase [Clostridiales Family XIII bacterium]|jgi:N-acyl-D-aspartate/D-glutamate deacylase|nr:D-aminoacylase [Clostridiales Family XIII bacterium]